MSVKNIVRFPVILIQKLFSVRRYLEDRNDARIARARFNDPKSKIISESELKKRLF